MNAKVNYSVERLEADEGDRAHIMNELCELKQEHGIVGKTVVEFGCGFGHNLEVFRGDNQVIGLEGLAAAVDRAKRSGLDVRLCDLNGATGLGDGSVDVALCLDVLEHLVEPRTALAEMHRALKPGGLAILNVPNHFDLAGRIKILVGRTLDTHDYFPDHDEWDNPHIRFFTHDGFNRLVRGSGFSVIDDRSSHIPSFPFQASLGLKRLIGLRRRVAARFPALFVAGHFLVARKGG